MVIIAVVRRNVQRTDHIMAGIGVSYLTFILQHSIVVLTNFAEVTTVCDVNKTQIIDCICCWYDLLGYGAPFMESTWDLHNEIAQQSIKRILQDAFPFSGMYSLQMGKRLHLNDGIISNHDIQDECKDPLYKVIFYLDAIVEDFNALNYFDQNYGYPGVRGVLTAGHRFAYENANITEQVAGNIVAYHPKEFQMNTAFSKAYIVEESGSRAGIKGNWMYIDRVIFDVFTKYSNQENQYSYCELQSKDKIIFEIYRNKEWQMSLEFDPEPIKYNQRGIHTVFYKLINKHSYIDEYFADAAHQDSIRYLLMDQMEENT